ncbi:MAG: HTH-type transcriptional regulator LutR [Syntrophorhabdaceae bacterium PtaU1.Bin034]|jgi:GntR family transcriptional repressor for pyruvate dehydrogenase complex|nr:MAG: HTH-type transcriptional regulator LutR [Syntrophorhabdaceae bacterium PtaU1.Bin034]
MPSDTFERIKSPKLSETIIVQIKKSIIEGRYKPGDRLPSEKELLEIFAVSRSSLREALRTLEEMGLIVIKRGALGGAYVRQREISSFSNALVDIIRMADITFDELSEMRLIVEPYTAKLAARNRTSEDVKELEKQNFVREKAIEDGKIPIVVDISFHQAIALACKNNMARLVMDSIASIFHEEFKSIALSLDDHRAILRFHKMIFHAVKNRDEEKAAALMEAHIADVTKRLKA